MKRPLFMLLLAAQFAGGTAVAREFILSDAAGAVHLTEWSISSADLGLAADPPFSVRERQLHGGRQEGVEVIDVDNGRMKFTVIPTRGMSIYRAECDGVALGWDSPVKEIVNPAYINLESRGGTGLVEGFNELLMRCGVEWAGHPGYDGGQLLSLHGRIGNIPASTVVVVVEDRPPHRIRVRGRVVEQAFRDADYELWTEISTEPGSAGFRISDRLTNGSDYEREFQIIYHGNFGPPLLERGAAFAAPVKRVTPFDDLAARDLGTWRDYLGPTANFGERVYMILPASRPSGSTTVMMHNAAADRGIQLRFNVNELPCFSLWKNTDTLKQGYLTGLEPGTGFPFSRAIERRFNRVPKLGPGQSRSFTIDYTLLSNHAQVAAVAREIEEIQGDTSCIIDPQAPALKPSEGNR